jgi:hypothetical protein
VTESKRNMLKIGRVRVSVVVEVMTLDGVKDETQVMGREPWGWSKTMVGDDTIIQGVEVCDMDSETAARYITESSRLAVESMLDIGYDPAND